MERIIRPSMVNGEIKAPPSKSMTQRAIAAAMLAEGESTILNPSYCDDSLAAMSIAVGLGARVEPDREVMKITGCRELKEKKLNCGESGLATRMFSPVAALYPEEIVLAGAGSLKKRPMFMIGDALNQLGVKCISTEGYLPLVIQGPLRGGKCEIDGSISSQLLTGLLMALPVAEKDSVVTVNNLRSKPYIDLTLGILKDFGINISHTNYKIFTIPGKQKYNARTYNVEGDWSGGAFLLVAGAINGNLRIRGLHQESRQSDRAILRALADAGAVITAGDDMIDIAKSPLKAFNFDATESPDLFPPLVTLAAYCEGVSSIRGAERLVYKESNRANALCEEFGKMGIHIEIKDNSFLVTGGRIQESRVVSHDDHRIAMAAAVAALGATGPVAIKDSHCISKSYPEFFSDLRKIGALVKE